MPTFKQVASSWQARVAIFAMVAVVALVAVSLGVPEAGGCGGAVPSSEPKGPVIGSLPVSGEGRIASASNLDSPTLTLDPPSAAQSFAIEQTIFASAAADGTRRSGQASLETIDYRTGTLTTTGENWSALIPGLQVGDTLNGMTASANATTYADGGGGGGSYGPPVWPANPMFSDTYSWTNGDYVFSWSAASRVYSYEIDQGSVAILSTRATSGETWVNWDNGMYFQAWASNAYGWSAGPSIVPCTSPNCLNYVNNGLPRLGSVPAALHGTPLATWFDSDPSYAGQLLPYLAGCALAKGTHVSFRGRQWDGELGLAPSFATGAPDRADQERVSACLMSRVNSSGRHVTISLRGDAARAGSQFGVGEAAWWGNLFVPQRPQAFCTMSTGAHRWPAADRGRICDAHDGFCGKMIDAGDCAHACTGARGDGAWSVCSADGVSSAHPITTFVGQ